MSVTMMTDTAPTILNPALAPGVDTAQVEAVSAAVKACQVREPMTMQGTERAASQERSCCSKRSCFGSRERNFAGHSCYCTVVCALLCGLLCAVRRWGLAGGAGGASRWQGRSLMVDTHVLQQFCSVDVFWPV